MFAMPSRSCGRVEPSGTLLVSRHADAAVPLCVLCIEDDPAVRLWLMRVFSSAGWIARTATNARRALRLVRGQAFDALIVDLRLPDTPGLELLRHLRAAGHTTPAIVLTGFPDVPTAIEALALGAPYFIKGAIPAEELVSAVRGIARRMVAEESGVDDPVRAALRDMLRADGPVLSGEGRAVGAARLAAALAHSEVPIRSFVFGVAVLRRLLDPAAVEAGAAGLVRTTVRELARTDPGAVAILEKAAEAVAQGGPGRRQAELDQVASVTGTTSLVLRGMLRAHLHLSWPRFRRAVIMRDAIRLLVLSDEQVCQIGYQLGYEHLSVFDREFHQWCETSPTRYRRIAMAKARATSQ